MTSRTSLTEEIEGRIRARIADPAEQEAEEMKALIEEIDFLRHELVLVYGWMDMLKGFWLRVNAQLEKPERTH